MIEDIKGLAKMTSPLGACCDNGGTEGYYYPERRWPRS